jgi:hypothetical protein
MSASKHAGCRIGSVTLKESGLRIVRLSSGPERTRRAIMSETREMLDGMVADGRPVVGFAMVMWDCEGHSDAACRAYPGSNIPTIAVPDFVRNRLLASKIVEWCKP